MMNPVVGPPRQENPKNAGHIEDKRREDPNSYTSSRAIDNPLSLGKHSVHASEFLN